MNQSCYHRMCFKLFPCIKNNIGDSVKHGIPRYVYSEVDHFWRCPEGIFSENHKCLSEVFWCLRVCTQPPYASERLPDTMEDPSGHIKKSLRCFRCRFGTEPKNQNLQLQLHCIALHFQFAQIMVFLRNMFALMARAASVPLCVVGLYSWWSLVKDFSH